MTIKLINKTKSLETMHNINEWAITWISYKSERRIRPNKNKCVSGNGSENFR